jgi:hypothetical protein
MNLFDLKNRKIIYPDFKKNIFFILNKALNLSEKRSGIKVRI